MTPQELKENEDYMVLNRKSQKISRFTYKGSVTDKAGIELYRFFDHDTDSEITVGLKWLKRAFQSEERCKLHKHLKKKRQLSEHIRKLETDLGLFKRKLQEEINENGYIVDMFPEEFI